MRALWILSLSLIITPLMAKPVIEVQPKILMTSKKIIKLGDITEFTEIDKKLVDKLSKIELGDAPEFGEKRVFTNHALSSLFRGHLPGDKRALLKIPSRVVIENKGYEMREGEVKEALTKKWQSSCSDCRIVIQRLVLPEVNSDWLHQPWKLNIKDDLPRGSFSVPVEFTAKNKTSTFWITGSVEIERRVPVATRMMYFGEKVREGDFKWEYRDVTFARDGIPEEDSIVGKRVRGSLRANQIIWMNNIEREKALNRGDVVRIISGTKDWTVTTKGVAQQDAHIGDTVKVKNPKTLKVISALVVGKGEVKVE